jgi:L-aspartate semialdehyde sulfurtransferase ferredoxin
VAVRTPRTSGAHWHLTFAEDLVSEPVLWELARTFDLPTNIRRANVEEHVGWVIVEVRGEPETLAAAREWLVARGVAVTDLD